MNEEKERAGNKKKDCWREMQARGERRNGAAQASEKTVRCGGKEAGIERSRSLRLSSGLGQGGKDGKGGRGLSSNQSRDHNAGGRPGR